MRIHLRVCEKYAAPLFTEANDLITEKRKRLLPSLIGAIMCLSYCSEKFKSKLITHYLNSLNFYLKKFCFFQLRNQEFSDSRIFGYSDNYPIRSVSEMTDFGSDNYPKFQNFRIGQKMRNTTFHQNSFGQLHRYY